MADEIKSTATDYLFCGHGVVSSYLLLSFSHSLSPPPLTRTQQITRNVDDLIILWTTDGKWGLLQHLISNNLARQACFLKRLYMFLHMCICLCQCKCRPEISFSYCSPGVTLLFVTESLMGIWGLPIMLDCMESSDPPFFLSSTGTIAYTQVFTFVLGSNSGYHVYAAAFYQLSHLMVSQLYLWKDDHLNHKHTSVCS